MVSTIAASRSSSDALRSKLAKSMLVFPDSRMQEGTSTKPPATMSNCLIAVLRFIRSKLLQWVIIVIFFWILQTASVALRMRHDPKGKLPHQCQLPSLHGLRGESRPSSARHRWKKHARGDFAYAGNCAAMHLRGTNKSYQA